MEKDRRDDESQRHEEHDPRLADLEDALASGREPDAKVRELIERCLHCAREATHLADTAQRIGAAVVAMDLEEGRAPSAAVRERVRTAALGASDGVPRSSRQARWRQALLGPLAWTSIGAAVSALVIAVALTIGSPPPVAASFALAGSDLAPGANGVVDLRPLPGGSIAMALTIRDLPASAPGEFYELWWVGPDKRHVSCGTFRSDGSPIELTFTSGVDLATTVLIEITLEQDDGDTTPGPHIAQ